jgi:hypothetical protein
MRPLPILLRLVPLGLLLGTSSALAFDSSNLGQWGSLPLDDLAPVIAKSPRLQQEIKQVLSEGNKKQEDVTCVGMRFPGQWKHLGGFRVSPYACNFGTMWLQIRATVRISDGRGQSFETITDKAMDNATNVSETNLNWKWTTECSPQSVPGWCS